MLKSSDSESHAEMVRAKLDGDYEVRPFPSVVSRLLSAIKDPAANVTTFAVIVESDVALSTRIMRMVNSPMFGFSNDVRSIKHAITILGQRPLKNLALAYAGTSIISSKNKSKEHGERLWNHSLGCATVARVLADSVSTVSSDDAFLAGIFHDIGKLFFMDVIPSECTKLIGCGIDLLAQETELFGLSHVEVGLRLAVSWPLPDEIKGVIRYHHEPEADTGNSDLTALIHVADGLARSGGIGSPQNHNICIGEQADKYFGLDEDALRSIQEISRQAFAEAAQAFSS